MKKILIFTVFLFPLSVFSQGNFDFDALYNSADLKTSVSNLSPEVIDSSKKYGVSYSLKGIIKLVDGKVLFYVEDGRIFTLDMKEKNARKYENISVEIYAKALQADNISVLKPQEISIYDPKNDIVLPAFQDKRRQPEMLFRSSVFFKVKNVRWDMQSPKADTFDWTNASIDISKLKNIYFVKKPFSPEIIAAHSFLLFTFEDGGVVDENGRKSNELILSIEAFLREGQSYSLTNGMKNSFSIVWLLGTWKDYTQRMVMFDKDSNRLVLYPLNFSSFEKKAVLEYALAQATVNRAGEYYHTITNNCTNNLVILFNHVLPENKKIDMWKIPYLVYNVRATMPVSVIGYLQGKKILLDEYKTVDKSNYTQMIP